MPTLTGRRRCQIPEHRKQIKSMQRWCAYLQGAHSEMWARRRVDILEMDDLRRQLYQKQGREYNKGLRVGLTVGFVLSALLPLAALLILT